MSRSLEDLRPEIRPMVEKLLENAAAAEIDVVITSTLRSFAEQSALYARGRTAPGPIVTRARAGDSPHNWGLAVDVVVIRDGKAVWDVTDPTWDIIGDIGEQAGLRWLGARGTPFPDYGHFEHPLWRVLAQQLEA